MATWFQPLLSASDVTNTLCYSWTATTKSPLELVPAGGTNGTTTSSGSTGMVQEQTVTRSKGFGCSNGGWMGSNHDDCDCNHCCGRDAPNVPHERTSDPKG